MPRTQKVRRPPRGSRVSGPTLRERLLPSGKIGTYAVFDGRFFSFGSADDPASRARFAQLKAAWEANGRKLPAAEDRAPSATVEDLADAFLAHAETYYRRKDGAPTGTLWHFKQALHPLLLLYRDLPAAEFDLPKLKLVRQSLIDARRRPRARKDGRRPPPDSAAPARFSRRTINALVGRIVHVFRWGVEERMVPATVAADLRELRHLQAGRSPARETEPRQPVSEAAVLATLPHLPRRIAAIVQVLWLTGARCGEIVQLRTRDVSMTGNVWVFRPEHHKNAWRSKPREIDLGPQTQAALRAWVKLDPDAYWFDPREEVAEQLARRTEARATPRWPSHMLRNERQRRAERKRPPGPLYSTLAVSGAIRRACRRAKIAPWSPHQLRHAALSRIRERFGLEAAQAVGGHACLPMTEHYTREAERALARKVAGEVG